MFLSGGLDQHLLNFYEILRQGILGIYSHYSITRNFSSEIIRKLSVTVSRKFLHCLGMVSRKNLSIAWPNFVNVG